MVDPITEGEYFTDGKALYCVVVADENGLLLEDCGVEEVVAMDYQEFAAKHLRRVEPAAA